MSRESYKLVPAAGSNQKWWNASVDECLWNDDGTLFEELSKEVNKSLAPADSLPPALLSGEPSEEDLTIALEELLKAGNYDFPLTAFQQSVEKKALLLLRKCVAASAVKDKQQTRKRKEGEKGKKSSNPLFSMGVKAVMALLCSTIRRACRNGGSAEDCKDLLSDLLEMMRSFEPLAVYNFAGASEMGFQALQQMSSFLRANAAQLGTFDGGVSTALLLEILIQEASVGGVLRVVSSLLEAKTDAILDKLVYERVVAVLEAEYEKKASFHASKEEEREDAANDVPKVATTLAETDSVLAELLKKAKGGGVNARELGLLIIGAVKAIAGFYVHARSREPVVDLDCSVYFSGDSDNSQTLDTRGGVTPAHSSTLSESYEIEQIKAGSNCTFVLSKEGKLYAFGKGDYGRLGLGHSNTTQSPTALNLAKITKFWVSQGGYGHGYAMDEEGIVFVWGDSDFGKLGTGESRHLQAPERHSFFTGQEVSDISCGWQHSAAACDGKLYTWGLADDGRLGQRPPSTLSPVEAPLPEGCGHVTNVCCGQNFTLASTESGQLLVTGASASSNFKIVDLEGERVFQLAAGAEHGLILTDSGKVWSFGGNSMSGNSENVTLARPVQLTDLPTIAFVACGSKCSFAIAPSNEVYAWGNSYTSTPQLIDAATGLNIRQISGGLDHCVWFTTPPPSCLTSNSVVPVQKAPFVVSLCEDTFKEIKSALSPFVHPAQAFSGGETGGLTPKELEFVAVSMFQLARANVLHFVTNRMDESEIDPDNTGVMKSLREIFVNNLASGSPDCIQSLAQTIFAESWAALLPKEAPQRTTLMMALVNSAQDELTNDSPLSPSVLFLANVLVEAIEVDGQLAKSFNFTPSQRLEKPVEEKYFELVESLLRTCTGVFIRNTELMAAGKPIIVDNPFLSLVKYLQQFAFAQRLTDSTAGLLFSEQKETNAAIRRFAKLLATAAQAVLMQVSMQDCLSPAQVSELLNNSVLRVLLPSLVFLQTCHDDTYSDLLQILLSLDTLNRSDETSQAVSEASLSSSPPENRGWLLCLEDLVAKALGVIVLETLDGETLTEGESAHSEWLGKQLFSGGLKETAGEPTGRHDGLLKDLISATPSLRTTLSLMEKVVKYAKSQWLMTPVVDKEHDCVVALVRCALACQLQHHGLAAAAVIFADDQNESQPPPALAHVITTTFAMRNRLYTQLHAEYPHLAKHHEDAEALYKEEGDLVRALCEPIASKLAFLMARVRAAIPTEESIAPQRSTVGVTGGGYFDLRASAPEMKVAPSREDLLRSAITRDDSVVRQKNTLLRENVKESLWKPMSVVVGTLRRYQQTNKVEVEAARKDLSRQVEEFAFDMELDVEDMEKSFSSQQIRAESRLTGIRRSIELLQSTTELLPSARTYLLQGLLRGDRAQAGFRDLNKDIHACSRDTRNLLEEAHHEFLVALLHATSLLGSPVAAIVSANEGVTGRQRDLLALIHGITCKFSASDVNVLVSNGLLQTVLEPVLRLGLVEKFLHWQRILFNAGVRAFQALLGSASLYAEDLDLSTLDEIQEFLRSILTSFLEKESAGASMFLDFLQRCFGSEPFCAVFSSSDWIQFFITVASTSSSARDRVIALRAVSVLLCALPEDSVTPEEKTGICSSLTSLYASCLAIKGDTSLSQMEKASSTEIGFSSEPEATLKCKVLPSQDTIQQTVKAKMKDNGFAYGNVCFTGGMHSFKYKILVDRENDESFALGIARERPGELSKFVFTKSDFTWLIRTYKGNLYHDGELVGSDRGKCSKGDILTMEVDLRDPENGTLTIYKNGTQLGAGPAFTGISGPVYPFVAFYNGYEECFVSVRLYDHVVIEDGGFQKLASDPEELDIMFPSARTALLQEIVELLRRLAQSEAWSQDITAMITSGLSSLATAQATVATAKAPRQLLCTANGSAAHLSLQYLADAFSGARLGSTVDSVVHGFGTVLGFRPSGNTAAVYYKEKREVVSMAIAFLSPVSTSDCPLDALQLDQSIIEILCFGLAALSEKDSVEAQLLQVLVTKAVAKLASSDKWVRSLLPADQTAPAVLLDLATRPLPVKNLVNTADLERTIYFVRELLYVYDNELGDAPGALPSVAEDAVSEKEEKSEQSGTSEVEDDLSCEEVSAADDDLPEEVPELQPEPRFRKRSILSRVFTLFSKEEKPYIGSIPSEESPSVKPSKMKVKAKAKGRDTIVAASTIPDQKLLEDFFDFDTRLGSIGLSGKGEAKAKSLKKAKFKAVKFPKDGDSPTSEEPLVAPPKLNNEELNALIAYVKAQVKLSNREQVVRVLHLLLSGMQIQLAREAMIDLLAAAPVESGKPMVDTSRLDVTKLIQLVRLVVCGRATAHAQEGVNRMTHYLMQHCKQFSDRMLQYCIRVLFSMADSDEEELQFSSDHDALHSAKFAIARELLTQLDPSHPCYFADLLDGLCIAALSKGAQPNQRSWCVSRIASIINTATARQIHTASSLLSKSTIFSQFCSLLPSVLSAQAKLENRSNKGFTRSVFLQSLLAISYMVKAKLSKVHGNYGLLVQCCQALHSRSGNLPCELIKMVSFPVDAKLLPAADLATAQDNSKWTLAMDTNLLEWKQAKPEDWANPTDVFCSGDASTGALGNLDFNPPTPLVSEQFSAASPTKVVAGESCSFLLDNEGCLFSVGKGDYGRLGNGANVNTTLLTPMTFGDARVVDFHVSHGGYGSGFAIDQTGSLWAWGDKDFGKLGVPDSSTNHTPERLTTLSEVTHVYAANRHTMAVSQEELYVWGQARYARSPGDITAPKHVNELDSVVAAAGGEAHTVVLTHDGNKVWAWGDNSEGELGLDGGDRGVPEQTALDVDDLPFVKVEAGDQFSLLLSKSGRVYWSGSLGGSNSRGFACVEELANERVVDIVAGKLHVLALTEEGTVYAWGSNSHGQCGTGGTDVVATPAKVELPRRIRQVTAGAQHSIIWASEDSLDNLLPSAVPPQYENLADVFGTALLVRMKLLQKFSDVMFQMIPVFLHAGRQWFHFDSVKPLLTHKSKVALLDKQLASTMDPSDHGPTVTVNRFEAKTPNRSVFCQVSLGVGSNPAALRCASRAFRVELTGEGSYDAGGPYNDVISSIADELMDCNTPVTELTPNGTRKEGNFQDCVVPAAMGGKNMVKHFRFLGIFLGVAIRTRSPVQLTFPPIFWKLLLNEPVGWADLAEIDSTFVESHQLLMDMEKKGITEEAFECLPLDVFPPLRLPGGGHLALSFHTRSRYVQLAVKQRITRWDKQISCIRAGMDSIVQLRCLALFTWEEVATLVCGSARMDWTRLRNCTTYQSGLTSSSEVVTWLWEVLTSFSDKDASRFLRFVWGKSRLPRRLTSNLVIEGMPAGDGLPKSATCFFKLSLPRYTSKELLEKRLRTAITYCTAIDTDNDQGLQGFDLEPEDLFE